jgi:Family of unknown function (DUF5677)
MSPEPTDFLKPARESFHRAIDFGLRVSVALNGKPATEQSELASIVQTKMCVTGASIEHMFTAALADHSAIIALCRMVMDACTLYFYLMEKVQADEWECRYTCLKLHDTSNRIRLMRGFQSENEYADLIQGRDELKKNLEANAYFKTLTLERATALLTGEHFYVRGLSTAAEKCVGWNFRKYLALYSYLSAHSHTSPMSFFRMKKHEVNFSEPSEAQRAAVVTALGVAEYCLLNTSLAYLDTQPDVRQTFDRKEIAGLNTTLATWKETYEK